MNRAGGPATDGLKLTRLPRSVQWFRTACGVGVQYRKSAGDRAVIPAGTVVTIGEPRLRDALEWIRVDGTLRQNMMTSVLEKPGAAALPSSPGEAVSRFRGDIDQVTDRLRRRGDEDLTVLCALIERTIGADAAATVTWSPAEDNGAVAGYFIDIAMDAEPPVARF